MHTITRTAFVLLAAAAGVLVEVRTEVQPVVWTAPAPPAATVGNAAPPDVVERRAPRVAPPRPVSREIVRAARPRPAARPARPVPQPPVRRAVARVARPAPPAPAPPVARPAPAGPTSWPELNRAIARIPTYRAGQARWVVLSHDGYWGTVDWATSTVFIGPQVPVRRLYDVAVHEWSHVLSLRAYGGDQRRAMDAMNAFFGGSGLTGTERAADCMAILQGATWTNYTSCRDARWRAGAGRLLRGRPA